MRDASPAATAERLTEVAAAQGLTSDQIAALVAIGSGTNRAVGVHGAGGVGKSTLVRALAEATRDDHIVLALAPTSSAAAELGRKASIESRTLASLLARGGHGISDRHIPVLDEPGQPGKRPEAGGVGKEGGRTCKSRR